MSQLKVISCDRTNDSSSPISHSAMSVAGEILVEKLKFLPMHSQESAYLRSDTVPTNSSPRKTRRRGVVLSEAGWQKLVQAKIVYNEFGERYTFEYFSERTLLDPRTICRILGREIAVDKRSLKIFFQAFDLELDQNDFTTPGQEQGNKQPEENPTSVPPLSLPLSVVPTPLPSQEDVLVLKQQIAEICRLFIKLHHLDNVDCVALPISDRVFMVIL